MRKFLPFLIWVLLFGLALACGSSQSGGGAAKSDQPTQAPAAQKVGDEIIVGEVRWKVLEAKTLGQELKSSNEFIKPKTTSGKFVLVRLEVENRKSEAATYAGIDLVDSKDRTFQRYAEQVGFIPEEETCILESLNPNISRTCTEIFELPGDAQGVKAKLGDLAVFGSKETLVDLGF
jgi:hypothetical protein